MMMSSLRRTTIILVQPKQLSASMEKWQNRSVRSVVRTYTCVCAHPWSTSKCRVDALRLQFCTEFTALRACTTELRTSNERATPNTFHRVSLSRVRAFIPPTMTISLNAGHMSARGRRMPDTLKTKSLSDSATNRTGISCDSRFYLSNPPPASRSFRFLCFHAQTLRYTCQLFWPCQAF